MICVVEYGEHIGTLRNLFPLQNRLLHYPTVSIDVSDRISGTAKRKRSMSKSKAWGIEFFSNPDI
jgi:hypothetical protein